MSLMFTIADYLFYYLDLSPSTAPGPRTRPLQLVCRVPLGMCVEGGGRAGELVISDSCIIVPCPPSSGFLPILAGVFCGGPLVSVAGAIRRAVS